VTIDAAPPAVATDDASPVTVEWRWIAALATVVLAVLALYCVGVLLPYFVNGLDRLPLEEVASGAHDPEDLWPQDMWAGPVGMAGLFSVAFGLIVSLGAVGVGTAWLASLWRRPGPGRLPKSLTLLVVVAGCVAAVLFQVSETGAALQAWRLD
jgi:ABC-type Fe3+ transport system permease subunit